MPRPARSGTGHEPFNGRGRSGIQRTVSTTAPPDRPDAAASDEARLLADARTGDPEARERLVARYVADVYDAALRVLGDPELAADAAQDAWVNALGALGRFRGESSLRTWLIRIAINAARSTTRRRLRRREVTLDGAGELPGAAAEPAAGVMFRGEAERMEAALRRLPEKQRLAVTLRVYQGLGYREIAQVLDSTDGAVRVNYHLGIKRLRELLK